MITIWHGALILRAVAVLFEFVSFDILISEYVILLSPRLFFGKVVNRNVSFYFNTSQDKKRLL